MPGKDACLIVDLREGMDMTKVVDMITVLEAAGWRTKIALKEYGGETAKLARKAVKQGYDFVIAYGGDGTLNAVVNGVMGTKGKSIVGLIPGGTANEWAGEMGVPEDSMKAALTLVGSEPRHVDLGHASVQRLLFPNTMQQSTQSSASGGNKKKVPYQIRQYFLLMAGIGLDAAILAHTSKPLKYRLGRLAFDLAAVKELPQQHPFPVEIHSLDNSGDGDVGTLLWQGDAVQVIVANTRRYANLIDVAPHAYIDDGILDVCVIKAGNPISTLEQAASLFLRHKPDNTNSEYLRGMHLTIRVPASIALQLDGNSVKLEDYLSKADRDALQNMQDRNPVMVEYRFDAEPQTLPIAIPRTYDNTLFEKPANHVHPEVPTSQQIGESNADQPVNQAAEQQATSELVNSLMEQGKGYKIKVVGVGPNPEKQDTYIIAGTTYHADNDKTEPAGIRVNDKTLVLRHTGERVPPAAVQELQEGAEVVVEGKRNKRGVIRATRLVI